jgi:hypothetical protein
LSSTVFVNGVTLTDDDWFNDTNALVYDGTLNSAATILDISGAAQGKLKFPATQSASSNANTLDDYQEQSFTLADASGAGLSITNTSLSYTKIGRLIVAQFDITYPVTADGTNASLSGLPVTSNNSNRGGGFVSNTNYVATAGLYFFVNPNAITFRIFDGATQLTNANLSGKTLSGTIIYTP